MRNPARKGLTNSGSFFRFAGKLPFGFTFVATGLILNRDGRAWSTLRRLVMSSGHTYDVRHPEMALLTRSDLLVGIDETEDGVPAEFRICSLLHVSAIEPINSASAGS